MWYCAGGYEKKIGLRGHMIFAGYTVHKAVRRLAEEHGELRRVVQGGGGAVPGSLQVSAAPAAVQCRRQRSPPDGLAATPLNRDAEGGARWRMEKELCSTVVSCISGFCSASHLAGIS